MKPMLDATSTPSKGGTAPSQVTNADDLKKMGVGTISTTAIFEKHDGKPAYGLAVARFTKPTINCQSSSCVHCCPNSVKDLAEKTDPATAKADSKPKKDKKSKSTGK